MKITSIQYFFAQAFKSLVKNSLMTVAAIVTVASCIFILLVSYNFASNINYMLGNVQKTMALTAYINDNINNDAVKTLYDKISTMDNVKSVKYISSTDAFESFKASLKDNDKILDGLPADTLLPRSFEIFLNDNTKISDFIDSLKKDVGDDKSYSSINYAKEETDFMVSINNVIRIVGIALFLGLGIISTIIITNTIKIAVNNRKTEINIMKYVGATDWFIRWPFVIEGIIIGLIGSIIPILITYFMYGKVTDFISKNLSFANSIFTFKTASELFSVSIPISLFLGILIGIIGSVTSIHKHLKV